MKRANRFFARIITLTLAIIFCDWLLPGVHLDKVYYSLLVALVISALNTVVKPLLILLTLPVTILTLGLFLVVINGIIIMLAAKLIPEFHVDGFWWALGFSIILSFTVSMLESFQNRRKTN